MKTTILTAALVAFSTSAFAGVTLEASMPTYAHVPVTEQVEVCHKVKDRTTEGAIIGGLLGSKDGNAFAGALIGGLLGDAVGGHTECKTETRTVGHKQVITGYDIRLNVDGKIVTLHINN